MRGKYLQVAFVAVVLALPAQVLAGGPPRLCLPIDGVTAKNQEACAHLLAKKLDDKLWEHRGDQRGVTMQEYQGQWYAKLVMGQEISLANVEKALAGTSYSVPRDRLHLFGHVTVTVDAPEAKAFLKDLEALAHVSVGESKTEEGKLVAVIDMPYPTGSPNSERGTIDWVSFQRCDFSSDQSTRSESPAAAGDLPGYNTLRDLAAKHKVKLSDVRWDPRNACRELGAVAVD